MGQRGLITAYYLVQLFHALGASESVNVRTVVNGKAAAKQGIFYREDFFHITMRKTAGTVGDPARLRVQTCAFVDMPATLRKLKDEAVSGNPVEYPIEPYYLYALETVPTDGDGDGSSVVTYGVSTFDSTSAARYASEDEEEEESGEPVAKRSRVEDEEDEKDEKDEEGGGEDEEGGGEEEEEEGASNELVNLQVNRHLQVIKDNKDNNNDDINDEWGDAMNGLWDLIPNMSQRQLSGLHMEVSGLARPSAELKRRHLKELLI